MNAVSRRVLVVDDSPTMRSVVRAALEDAFDVEVYESNNGFEALKALPETEPLTLIVTDINMPEINGLELLNFVRSNERYKNVPVVIVSTENQSRDRQRGVALGASGYLVKPFEASALVAMCRPWLA